MGDSLKQFVIDLLADLRPESPDSQILGAEEPGHQIGRYRLIECLGEGGFGTVWRAEQTTPLKRQVALKITKLGMDTREVIARFEAERQALAVLDHPHIAKVFDAGATPAGRPYFVMELVRGEPITQYCHREKLPLRERLALLVDVCRAVQHAHQKGIIHRDLKPSNLLVALADGKPAPKVIDFGIAKAVSGERLTENTFMTRVDRLMGTPAYMSPEQAEPSLDIDTRADIYSLGVILYELVTGQLPWAGSPEGMGKHDRTAQRPSTRLKSLTEDQLKQLGETQQIQGPKLIGLVKGDLDWIAMKALEPDRSRRYDSANALAEDLCCYLDQKAVSARPPTAAYLFKRFTQRNKLAVGAAASILLVLIAGVTASTWMYLQEKRALTKSEQVSKFLKQVLEQAGPLKALGRDTTMMREILDQTVARIGTELKDQPEVQAELCSVLSATYSSFSDFPPALEQATESLRLLRLSHHDDETLAVALYNKARPLIGLGRFQEAVDAFTEALTIRRRLWGEKHLLTATLYAERAWPLMKLGRKEEAEKDARLAMEVWRRLPDQTILLGAPASLEMILHETNRGEEAVAVSREELAAVKKKVGTEHPLVSDALDNLGYELENLKRDDEARQVTEEGLRLSLKFRPGHDGFYNQEYSILMRLAVRRQDWAGELNLARRYLAERKASNPPDPQGVQEADRKLAKTLIEQSEHYTPTDPARSIALLDELQASKDFETEAKAAAGWLDCLRGMAQATLPDARATAAASIQGGIERMKKKVKPTDEDTRRLKKAEAELAKISSVSSR